MCIFSAVLLVSAGTGGLAYAANNDNVGTYTFAMDDDEITLHTVYVTRGEGDSATNVPVGVQMHGYYFGNSGIPVTVEVYSSDAMPIDFEIGAKSLTAAQQAVRGALVELFAQIHRLIVRVDMLANTQYDGSTAANGAAKPISDVYRYNAAPSGTTLEIARETYEMLQIARQAYDLTDGAFDPAVYRLVDLWGFSSRIWSDGAFGLPYDREVTSQEFIQQGYPLPDDAYVKAFSAPQFTDFGENAVILRAQGDKYYVTKNVAPAVVYGDSFEQWIDLGGVAKGYVVDEVKRFVSAAGFDGYYVDAGTSSMSVGAGYDGNAIQLGMSDAFDPMSSLFAQTLFAVDVTNADVSVSGQNIRTYTRDGVQYAHILDGTTGVPAQTGVRSVMVIVPQSAGSHWATLGDCITTALTVMGRDGIVNFINDQAKQYGIKVAVQYSTIEGKQQLLTNIGTDEMTFKGDNFANYTLNLEQDEQGNYRYNADVRYTRQVNPYVWLSVCLGAALGIAAVGLVVYHFVRGKRGVAAKLNDVRTSKPFRAADVGVYLAVALLIVVLFGALVLDGGKSTVQVVTVVDDQAGENLFVYNVQRNEWQINYDNANGWQIQIESDDDNVLKVKFSRDFDGETRYNVLQITRGSAPSVKMIESVCGFHQDCVRNFPAVTQSGAAIVCSPNRLKVIT